MALATVQQTRLDIRAIRTFDDLGLIANAWTQLQKQSSDATVFSTWQWNHAAARHLWRPDAPRVTLVEAAGGPIGILPLAQRRIVGMRGLAFLGTGPFNYGRADYQDALIEDGWEMAACDAFVDSLVADASTWDVVMLQDLPSSSRLLRALPPLAADQGWIVTRQPDNDVYLVDLPSTWDEYTARLSTNVRSNLGRKQRKLEREHNARFERIDNADALDAGLDHLFHLHNHRWREKHGSGSVETIFSRTDSIAFHREVARNLLWAGMLDLTLLQSDAGVIGARYSFEYNGSHSFYASGYRTDEDWAKFSLGAVMDLQSIQSSIQAGFKYEDLLRNEGDYKARYAPRRSDNQRLFIFKTRSAYLRYSTYRNLKATAKSILRRGTRKDP